MFLKKLTLFQIIFLITLLSAQCYAWYETRNLGIGNFETSSDNFLEIPDSPYAIYYSYWSMVTVETNSAEIKGYYKSYEGLGVSSDGLKAILPDPVSGWNLYYPNEHKFGVIHITIDGEIESEKWLDKTWSTSFSPVVVGIPDRFEAWLIFDRIFRYNAKNGDWSEFNYPQGSDPDMKNMSVFKTGDNKNLFIIWKGLTIGDFQLCSLDLITGEAKLIQKDKNFFQNVWDIDSRNKHPNEILICKSRQLWYYDYNNGNFELLVDGVGENRSIFQDNEGKYLYFLGTGKDLYKYDFDEKKLDTLQFTIAEDYGFTTGANSISFYDADRNRIIALLTGSTKRSMKLAYLEISDLSLHEIGLIPDINKDTSIKFIKDKDILLAVDNQYIHTFNVDNGEHDVSIPIMYKPQTWSVMKGALEPTLTGNSFGGTDFVRLKPFGRTEFFNAGSGDEISIIAKYTQTEKALLQIGTIDVNNDIISSYIEYNFDDNTISNIELPFDVTDFLPDPEMNQILGIKKSSKLIGVQFIRPNGNIQSWQYSKEGVSLNNYNSFYDPDNRALWFTWRDFTSTSGGRFFSKISLDTYDQVDSFEIHDGIFSDIMKMVVDPDQKYLYTVSSKMGDNNLYTSEFHIFDIKKREEVKKFTYKDQLSTQNYPIGILPVPQKNKILLWDHFNSFCIDTKTLELTYGEINNKIAENMIDGYWDDIRQLAVFVDTNRLGDTSLDPKKVLEIDIETGNLVRDIDIPLIFPTDKISFSSDRNRIFFMGTYNPAIYTMHITSPWENPPAIRPSTNYLHYSKGDICKFNLHIENPSKESQNATAYIWLFAPKGEMLFFDGSGFTFDVKGIPVNLPSGFKFNGSLLSFVMPDGMPKGYYNLAALFYSDELGIGPMGNWNFYIGDTQ
jgi:hypothetical protein